MNWTTDQILKLAPDAASAQAAQGLLNLKKWSSLGTNEKAAWGACQGSGSKPYQTQVDLSEPAFKCSCPSHKFPCKHALALFLLLAEQPGQFKQKEPPGWVAQWLASRAARLTKKEAKEAKPSRAKDPEAQAKTAAVRLKRVQEGAEELRRWLEDLVRSGFAGLASKEDTFWQNVAARMVDAQAPGLARLVRELGVNLTTGPGWQDRMLEAVARIYLLIEGFSRIDVLPEDVREDIGALVGLTQEQKLLLEEAGTVDHWVVLGQRTELEDRLQVQRSWLRGVQTGRTALALAFAYGNQPPVSGLIAGTSFHGELVFFPGRVQLRALVRSRDEATKRVEALPGDSLEQEIVRWSERLAAHPWLTRFPLVTKDVVPAVSRGAWYLLSADRKQIPLHPRFAETWKLAAISGGLPISICGEWDGYSLMPLSAIAEGRFHEFSA